ncbi:MAG TPA: hypothetical protein VLM18_10070 [Croceibacterium sp.]|nr:hypothetical protein [Croceibacterium sp.]
MRYFFNLAGAVYDPDNQGHELADLPAARFLSVELAADMLRDKPQLAWTGEEFRVEVTNVDRLLLFTVIVIGVDAPVSQGR